MSKFRFPYNVDLSNTKPILKKVAKDKKYICDGINLLEYLTEDEINKADNIVVFGSKLTWFKGVDMISPYMEWESVNFEMSEHPNRAITAKNLYVSWLPTPSWNFNEITTDYHKEKNQPYIKVSLEESSSELDVLELASGLTYTYGYYFTIHTVSEKKGIYHLTVTGNTDVDLDIFNEIVKHQNEIHEDSALWIECKIRKTEGKEENLMPVVPSSEDWEW